MKKSLLLTVMSLSVLGMQGAQSLTTSTSNPGAKVVYGEELSDSGLLKETMRKARLQQQINDVSAQLGELQQKKAAADTAVGGLDGQIAGIRNTMGQEEGYAKNMEGAGEKVGASAWRTAVATRQEKIDEMLMPKRQQYAEASAQYGEQIAALQGRLKDLRGQL